MKYEAIIYDIDGTILNTARMNIIPLIKLCKEVQNKEYSYNDLLFILALPGKVTLERLGFDNIEANYAKWVQYVNEFEEGASLYDGFDRVIEEINSRGIIQGIVSSKTKAQYEIDFVPKGLDIYMKECVLTEDTINHKPHPEPLLLIADKLGIDPQKIIYIGDALSDYQCARAAGMDFGFAKWGSIVDISDADYIFNSPLDILLID